MPVVNKVQLKLNSREIKTLMKTNIPFGFWPSDIGAEQLGSASIRYSEPKIHAQKIYWLESRPAEKGRSVLVECFADATRDLLPETFSVRTRAQEYGGACYAVADNSIYFVNDKDQAVYSFNMDDQQIKCIAPGGNFRYTDFCLDQYHHRLLAIRETSDQTHSHPVTDIVSLNLNDYSLTSLISGNDFYSNARISPCGAYLSFLTWNHPHMPWDSSYCIVCDLDNNGLPISQKTIAGSNNESIFQPQWSADNQLFFVSDRSNWWNLYRWDGVNTHNVYEMSAEFATPQWVFGMSTYGFLDNNHIFCSYSESGQWKLARINWREKQLNKVDNNFTDISNILCDAGDAVFIAASAYSTSGVYKFSHNQIQQITHIPNFLPYDDISVAQAISFSTSHNQTAYAFFYPPVNSKITNSQIPPDKVKPPLIVMCHGGPTGACETGLNLKIQFWTNRGFAVLDVNYRGSTGYGRRYRDALKQHWGITDVEDVCHAAEYLVQQGVVAKTPIIIRGSSAGGFTVLAALTFATTFSVGCSLYGIGDLEALAKDTHKFEAHYLDQLIGRYPEQQEIYWQRSPIHHTDQLNCPVIIFQGMLDKVVPPNQAEAMVNALTLKGIDVEYVTFPDEAHGFRQAHNIQQQYEKELAFYQKYLQTIN